ncbi:MAG: FAD-dependent monooxygenase [Xanthomonadales bacterium]|nr:FAD-dependent monooxygenase [Xanthomonadales bacterium]
MSRFDFILVGGGMAGAAAALALDRADFRVAVLDPNPPEPIGADDPYDLRVSTLNPASVRILQALGAWSGISSVRACAFSRMQVWDDDPAEPLVFDRPPAPFQALGHLVENRLVRQALWNSDSQVEFIGERLESLDVSAQTVAVKTEAGKRYKANWLIGADGARSPVRDQLGIGVRRRPYFQAGVVAQVDCPAGLRSTAWQRFLETGPLAFLPLDETTASIVWSLPTSQAAYLVDCDEDRFNAALNEAFQGVLGKVAVTGPRRSFPLARQSAERYVSGRAALLGDAAHVVHPLAGQGANLGLTDAAALAEVMTDHAEQPEVAGRRYERWRRSDAELMGGALSGIKWIYSWDEPGASLRRFGTRAIQRLPWLKARFIEHASGFGGQVPRLARARGGL